MQYFKIFKSLILSSILFTTPLILNAVSPDPLSSLTDVQLMEQSMRNHSTKSKRSSRKLKPLELADFRGEWIGHGNSIGGVTGADAVGVSADLIFPMTLKGDGNGTIHSGSLVTYTGTDDVAASSFIGEVKIEITNSKYSTGTITFLRPDSSAPNGISIGTFNFVAQRSRRTGEVIRITSHRVSLNTEQTQVVFQEFFRQYVD